MNQDRKFNKEFFPDLIPKCYDDACSKAVPEKDPSESKIRTKIEINDERYQFNNSLKEEHMKVIERDQKK